ncbi:NUDIX domain-containing protein [Epibacterium sp. SM1979]|uniref:NUDIX domain-containing protein n=1 Tax=Tritonibacter litoralis TaxID=2662264 RepID=A0A843YJK7_9RHOB|nr:NUDIX hydrolase [Tritonibacter litoralis]MQQ09442.1 NUDIX domain-containing protein [Tritonibacter litoralis]
MAKSPNNTRSLEQQYAALCYRVTAKGKLRFLLITSRGIGRWVLPKGWPMRGRKPWEAAQVEAWEEAGVRGRVRDKRIGHYEYEKWRDGERPIPCRVDVYPLEVASLEKDFPEVGQRERQWLPPKDAAELVAEPQLAEILATFRPKDLKTTVN